jgi:hypothetical protein
MTFTYEFEAAGAVDANTEWLVRQQGGASGNKRMSLARMVTWIQTLLTKANVGLSNVDNTSDADKPLSTASQQALASKQPTLVSGTNIKTVNGTSILGSGNVVVSNVTNLSSSPSSSNVMILSDTGSDVTLEAATTTNAGLFLPNEKIKLTGIAAAATANSADSVLLNRANHTGTQSSSTILTPHVSVSGTGTTHNFDYAAGQWQSITFSDTSSHTITVSNWPAGGNAAFLMIEMDNAGALPSITFPIGTKWVTSSGALSLNFVDAGVTLQTSGKDFLTLMTRDGGSTIYGKVLR